MPTFDQIKTPSQLKGFMEISESNQWEYYFNRKTMKFFGDTMRNYGLRKHVIDGKLVYELYRKKPVKHGLQNSHYFTLQDGSKTEIVRFREEV